LSTSRQRGSVIKIFQKWSLRQFWYVKALFSVFIVFAFAIPVLRLSAQAACSSEIRSSIQEEVTKSSLLCQDGRYKEAEPILLRCLSQYELTGKQDVFLLTILTNLQLVFTRLGKEKEAAACQAKRRDLEAKFDAVDISFAPDEPNVRKPKYGPKKFKFPAATTRQPREAQEPGESRIERDQLVVDAPAASGVPAEVRTVIAANEQDRDLISNPTKSERRVFDHNETHYGYRSDGSRYSYLEPIYRREVFDVTKEAEIPILEDLHSMCASHSLGNSIYQRCKAAIIDGGAVFELDNGFTVLVPETVNPDDWRLAKVLIQKHPLLRSPGIALSNLRNGASVNAVVLDSR